MTELHSSFMYALAGTSVFMFGMTLASESLQKIAANRIREILGKLSNKPYMGIVVGVALTMVVQSSGAVTSMLVGLGSAGVVTLRQVMSVLLGTAIGTTLTVQLLSLNVAQFGLPIFTFSFLFYFLTRNKTLKHSMAVFMGFGLIFWGLELIGIGTSALRDSNLFVEFLDYLKAYPLVAIVITAAFTGVVHSSAVTVGFAMTLAASGQITMVDAMYWVYGANIGTTATALMAASGGNYVGRQVAWAHVGYKILSVLAFYFLTAEFVSFFAADQPLRTVANMHTVFNVAAAIMFYPFINIGAKYIEKIFQPSAAEKEFSAKYLDRSNFQNMSVAMAHAQREALRMGDIVFSMVKDSLGLFKNDDDDLFESIGKRDNRVDLLNREINLFLAQFADDATSLPKEAYVIMSFVTDLESAADVIDNSVTDLARKKHALKLDFSAEGWKDLEKIHKMVIDCAEMSLSCFQAKDKELAAKVIYLKREVRKLEKQFRQNHIERLVEGRQETINTSSIHLDLLTDFRRMTGLLSNHVYGLLKDQDEYNLLPRRES